MENFPNLAKEIDTHAQEAQRIPTKMNPKWPTPRHIIIEEEILSLGIAWMDLESIMLSGISYSEKDKYHMNSPVCET